MYDLPWNHVAPTYLMHQTYSQSLETLSYVRVGDNSILMPWPSTKAMQGINGITFLVSNHDVMNMLHDASMHASHPLY